MRSIADTYESYEGFGKKITQPISQKHSQKNISYESVSGIESYEPYAQKKWSCNSFSENDHDQFYGKPVKGYTYENANSMSTMASFTSLGSIQSFSSAQSLNGVVPTQITNTPPKSKQKQAQQKKKGTADNDFRAKYKTEVCKYWTQTGYCQFGDQCAFAHGQQEIRQRQNLSSNYKTKKCMQFHDNGYCPYGVRCQFIHCLRNETRLNPNLIRRTYADDLENIEIWQSRDPDCICIKMNRPRLPVFVNSVERHEEHEEQKELAEDVAEFVRKYSPQINSPTNGPSALFSDEQSSDSSF